MSSSRRSKRPAEQDLQSLYDTALQDASLSEAKLLKELHDLGHYPVRTNKRRKTDTEKNEDSFSKRISKRWQANPEPMLTLWLP